MHQIRCTEGTSKIEPSFIFSIPLDNQRKNSLTRTLAPKLVQRRLDLLKQWEFYNRRFQGCGWIEIPSLGFRDISVRRSKVAGDID